MGQWRQSFKVRSVSFLAALFCAGSAGAESAPVYAAWSQVIGETVAAASAPAKVEMRFVIDAKAASTPDRDTACGAFLVAEPGLDASDVMSKGRTPVARKQTFKDIFVCRAEAPEAQVQLYDTTGVAVVLTSQMNLDNDKVEDGPWQPGPSNGVAVVVAGAAWIGRDATFKLLTLGDTGCRGGRHQNCGHWRGKDGWPLPQIASVGAEQAPDLVIHVGDFRYFHENALRQDSWALWQKDFFPVAQPLLLAAPWAMARGNHEGCSYASLAFGAGYFQFFGQSDDIDCDDLGTTAPPGETAIYRAPWYFDVMPAGGTPEDAHRFVIIDANDYEGAVGVKTAQAEAHFKTAINISAAGPKSSWWVWHSPALQRITWKQQPFGDPLLRQALLAAAGIDKADGQRFCLSGEAPNCSPSMFLLGHQHLYQDVSFPKDGKWIFPQATIVGHGGVNLRDSNPGPGHIEYCEEDDFPLGANGAHDVTGRVNTVVDHGFVLWTRKAGAKHGQTGWEPQYSWVSSYAETADGKISAALGGLPQAAPEQPKSCIAAQ
ncbi:metallophosphoesterase [Sagittula sp. S175]|uniref:metallophosphoesterase n=1 Tax=Sagittula sp. S175 TaxID=3415129 RepID=UPI003C7CE0A6